MLLYVMAVVSEPDKLFVVKATSREEAEKAVAGFGLVHTSCVLSTASIEEFATGELCVWTEKFRWGKVIQYKTPEAREDFEPDT